MHPRRYRALLVGTVLSWFLLGLHFPIVHEITEHGRVPHWSVVVAVVVISAAAVVTLWKLLRAPARGAS